MASNPRSHPPARGDPAGLPTYYSGPSNPGPNSKPRAGPNRSTKASGKLKILPEEPEDSSQGRVRAARGISSSTVEALLGESGDGGSGGGSSRNAPGTGAGRVATHSSPDDDEESSEGEEDEEQVEVYKQLAQIPEGSMRRDARRLTRKARARLPRVTAYSTATSYRMRELTRWLQARQESHDTNVLQFDECIYTTYTYERVDTARGLTNNALHSHGHGHGHGHSHSQSRDSHGGGAHKKNAQTDGHAPHGRRHAPPPPAPPHSPSVPRGAGRTGDLLGIPELANEEEIDGEGEGEGEGEDANKDANKDGDARKENNPFDEHYGQDGTAPRLSDEVVRERDEERERLEQKQALEAREEAKRRRRARFAVDGQTPEVFFMEYGTVVIWGMTLAEEKRLLRELRRFEVEKLAPEDVESEDLTWYLADYSRIYNDVITLRRGSSYMTKLSLSHALAQSTKISFFEGIIDNTIDTTKDIPQSIAESGKIGMPPQEIMKQIGHLFILRMNIHLVGSIVDSPEIFWAQPDLEPLYSAARSYLEIPQRIDLLNQRVEVLQDMLQLLKDQVTSSHSEWLEIIVIVLIMLEIVLGVATMIVDLYFA